MVRATMNVPIIVESAASECATDRGGTSTMSSQLPDFSAARQAAPVDSPPSEPERDRSRGVIIGVVVSLIAVLTAVSVVLALTVFRGIDTDPTALAQDQQEAPQQNPEGAEEYVPDESDPNIAPPPPIFTQQPTSQCSIPEHAEAAPSSGHDTVRGGGLEYTVPSSWPMSWGTGSLPYMNEVGGYARNVEGSWFSVVNVGRVVYPGGDDPYPGLEDAAVDLFQCYATTSGVLVAFGENPLVTDYRSEVTTVDGYEAWIVQATYNFEDPEYLATSSASVVTVIAVDTPGGPSALASDVAADVESHREDLDAIIASLKVVE